MQNPFSYSFGLKPKVYVVNAQFERIAENFYYDEPGERALMLTGVRGAGKTVMLSELNSDISERRGWIVIDLNRERDLLQFLAANLYNSSKLKKYMISARIDLSFFGLGVSLEKTEKSYDIELAVEQMLEIVQKQGMKVLVTIDEVRKSDSMKVFCQSFQRFIRKQLPIYLVMTGLYKDVHDIKTMDGCTFLNRAPFEIIKPLDINSIAVEYRRVLGVPREIAIDMAKLTKGYSFAFQVLGKLYFSKGEDETLEDLIFEYESELCRYSYNIIWNELSNTDRKVVEALILLGDDKPIKRKQLMEKLGISSSMMNRYQARLFEKGVLDTSSNGYGIYSLALPRFGNYVKNFYMN